MKTVLKVIVVFLLCLVVGCNGTSEKKQLFLTVDFQKDQTLRYKFVSSRDIEVDWGTTNKGKASSGKHKIDKHHETLEMVIAYTPIEVDPYGLSTVKATCQSVKVTRVARKGRRPRGKDAAETLKGKTFTFTVAPTGKIKDYSQLEKLIREAGGKAFRKDPKRGRIKNPDMVGDFIATQWFLWDSVSSIEKAAEGISVGQSWKSELWAPNPTILQIVRDVTYSLDQIRPSEKGQLAVIRSSYSLSPSARSDWPAPYTGRFRISGTFGFLTNYKVLDLQGQGEELFNIDTGRIEQYNQQYKMRLKASFLLPLGGAKPILTVKQNITMQLLE